MHNVLTERVIRTELSGGRSELLTLPQVYEALAGDRVTSFPGVRCHQRHPWHAFLAQVGAMAVFRSGAGGPPAEARGWREILRTLTGDHPDDEPWQLQVDDPGKPALLQCPDPANLTGHRRRIDCPDDLDDVVISAKNHEIKHGVARACRPDDWLLALVSLQTAASCLGRGKRQVVRMNGGYGSRIGMGLCPAGAGPGGHVMSDIERMLLDRDGVQERYPKQFARTGGIELVWLEPWDGKQSIDLQAGRLDPYFVEICRRVRLVRAGSTLYAVDTGSESQRIDPGSSKGDVGDFWTPVDRKHKRSVSTTEGSFQYHRLAQMLFDAERYRLPPAMDNGRGRTPEWRLIARGVASGQGQTGGYHERTDIVLGEHTVDALASEPGRKRLSEIATEQVVDMKHVEQALRYATQVAAGRKRGTKADARTSRWGRDWVRHLDQAIEKRFFRALEERFRARDAQGERAVRVELCRWAIALGRKLLTEACRTTAPRGLHGYRAIAESADAYQGMLHKDGSPFHGDRDILGAAPARKEEASGS